MANNNIIYVDLFSTKLDEAMQHGLLTSWMDDNAGKVKYEGGKKDMINKIVVYSSDIDANVVLLIAPKYKCAVMKEKDFKESKIKAKKVIKIGGNVEDVNRFETFKNAAKML